MSLSRSHCNIIQIARYRLQRRPPHSNPRSRLNNRCRLARGRAVSAVEAEAVLGQRLREVTSRLLIRHFSSIPADQAPERMLYAYLYGVL